MKPPILACLCSLLSLFWLAPPVLADPEGAAPTVVDGVYSNAAGPFVLGQTGSSDALWVVNGGRLEDTVGVLGAIEAASNNVARVIGAGSLWDNTQALYVGEYGPGNRLLITNGGRVNGGLAVMGSQATSRDNHTLVTGAGSQWSCLGGLQVGGAGSGNSVVLDQGGQIISGDYGAIGYSTPSSNNLLRVDGPGSGWYSYYQITVGLFGSSHNQCVVGGGGFLHDSYGSIGNGSNNLVLLTDPGTYWYNAGDFFVGDGGAGNWLVISNGAHLTCVSGFIGGQANSVWVAGPDSVWDTAVSRAQLVVGDRGYGNALVITNGGRVNSLNGLIVASNNSVTVEGPGAFWNCRGRINVGEEYSQSNQLTIAQGGYVDSDTTTLAGENGLLLVRGTNSLLNVTDWLSVGDEIGANNRFTISQGAQTVSAFGYVGGTASAFDPHGGNGNNIATITGSGSFWNIRSNLVVGATGPGSQLIVAAGGQIANASGYLGFTGGAPSAAAWVADTNSVWHSRGDLFVGYQSSRNRLVVTNGARIESANGFVGRHYNRDNAALITGPGSIWHNSGSLIVGNSGYNSRLTIANGGRVTCAVGLLDAPFDANPGTSNSVVVTGADSTWSVGGALTVGVSSSVNELRIEDAGTVVAGSVAVGAPGTLNNLLTLSGGNLIVTNEATNALLNLARAAMTLKGGSLTVDRLSADSQTVFGPMVGALTVKQSASIAGVSAFLVGTVTNPAQLRLGLGTHSFSGGITVAASSLLAAAGTINGNVLNHGSLAIGTAAAESLTLHGDLHLAETAETLFEVGGAPGTQHDFLRVTNAVQFGGLLRVALINGYRPASNDVYTLMQFGSGTGSFLNAASGARLVLEGSEVTARVDYTGTALRLLEFYNANPATNEIDPAWALRYFGHSPLTEEEKVADADGDGLRNAEEYWAGTDPLDPASVLRITSIRRGGTGEMALRFWCVAGRSYFIAYSTNLVSWTEVDAPSFTTPAPGLCEWIDDGSQTGGFPAGARRAYRVGTR